MNTLKFLKHGIRYQGKYIPVWYSESATYGMPEGTITIYARNYGKELPTELNPTNDTDSMTDYFDTDKARIAPSNKYYAEIKKIMEQKQ